MAGAKALLGLAKSRAVYRFVSSTNRIPFEIREKNDTGICHSNSWVPTCGATCTYQEYCPIFLVRAVVPGIATVVPDQTRPMRL